MATVDLENSFEYFAGLVQVDADSRIFGTFAGSGAPDGVAPVGSLYYDIDNQKAYRFVGPGSSDWQLQASPKTIALPYSRVNESGLGSVFLKSGETTLLGWPVPFESTLQSIGALANTTVDAMLKVIKNDDENNPIYEAMFNNTDAINNDGLSVPVVQGDRIKLKLQFMGEDIQNEYTDDVDTVYLFKVRNTDTLTDRIITNESDPQGNGGQLKSGAFFSSGTGPFGQNCLQLDGNNDYVYITHQRDYNFQVGTIELWFFADNTNGLQSIICKDHINFGTGGHFHLFLDGDDLRIRSQTTFNSLDQRIANIVDDDVWHHVAVVFGTGGGLKVFFNGVLEYQNGGWTQGFNGNREPLLIGADATGSQPSYDSNRGNEFDGRISNLRLSNIRRYENNFTVPTGSFVNDTNTVGLWKFEESGGTFAPDDSATKPEAMIQFTNSNSPEIVSSPVKFGTSAIELNVNTNSSWLNIPHHPQLQSTAWTFELWYYNQDGGSDTLMERGTGSEEGRVRVRKLENENIEVQYYGINSELTTLLTTNNSIPMNEFIHISVTATATQLTIYLNGLEAVSTALGANYVNGWLNMTDDIFLGARPNFSDALDFTADEIRFSNVARMYGGGDPNLTEVNAILTFGGA